MLSQLFRVSNLYKRYWFISEWAFQKLRHSYHLTESWGSSSLLNLGELWLLQPTKYSESDLRFLNPQCHVTEDLVDYCFMSLNLKWCPNYGHKTICSKDTRNSKCDFHNKKSNSCLLTVLFTALYNHIHTPIPLQKQTRQHMYASFVFCIQDDTKTNFLSRQENSNFSIT